MKKKSGFGIKRNIPTLTNSHHIVKGQSLRISVILINCSPNKKGLEKIITTLRNILQKNIQYSVALEEDNLIEEEAPEEEVEETSHTGLIVGLIIGLLVFIGFIVFLLFYLRRRFSEDGTKFQFKGMLSRGYWLDKNERFRPVSVNPLNTGAGGVYEPCSIEEPNHGHNDVDKRLREKLSQISDGSGDEEEMQVIEHIPHSDAVNSADSVSHPTAHVSAPSVPT
ncbi:unnamed protein product [Oppiella nova]|uniref:Uncharacterized protein n=1 Tax=Oppiella nova TaxID=334625 RepID=A0A7R9QKK6_9ACAR|nr:unnamed protein product [Oppiella nova]CAG2166852.1 unnamed protein product [Oppiella nova]